MPSNNINLNVNVQNLNQLRALEQEALKAAAAIKSVSVSYSHVPGGISNVEKEANRVFAALQSGAAGVGQVFRDAAKFSTAFLGFIVVNKTLQTFNELTVGSARAAADFEQQLAFVAKTANLTDAQVDKLSKSLRAIAREAPISTQELAKASQIAGQLGITGTENITKFAETITKLATATSLGVEEGATFLGRFQNIAGLPTDKLENLASTIVDLGNKFASTENEIAEFSLRLAGAGEVIGLKAPEITAFGNALASVGINAEAGGTAFSRVFLKLEAATIQGGTALSNFSRVAGLSTEAFKSLAKADPSQAIIKFLEGLQAIKASGGDVISVLEDLGLNEIRVRDALLRASSAGSLFGQSVIEANRAFELNAALEVEFARQTETSASKSQILSNNIKDLQIAIGSAFLPALANSSQNLANFTKGLSGSQEGVSDLGDSLNNTFELLRDGTTTITGMLAPLDKLSNSFNILGSSINVAAQALTALVLFQTAGGLGRLATRTGGGRLLGLAEGALVPTTFPVGIGRLGLAGSLIGSSGFLRPGVDPSLLPQFEQRIRGGAGGFRNPATGRIMAEDDAFRAINAAQIPEPAMRSFRAFRQELGTIAAIQLSAKSALQGIINFLSTPSGAFIGITAAIAGINEILERTTGEGILEIFSTGDERAKSFQSSVESLNKVLDSFNQKVSAGEITSFQAGQESITALAGRQNAAIVRQIQLQKELNDVQNSGKARFGAAVGNALGLIDPTKAFVEGGYFAGGIGRSISGEQKVRDNLAATKGEIEANTSALTDFARQFNLTFAELSKQRLEIENIGLSNDAKLQLKSDFQKTFKELSKERFAAELGALNLISDQDIQTLGPKIQKVLGGIVFTPEIAQGFSEALQEQQGGFTDFVGKVNQAIADLQVQQQQKLQALLAAEPDFFTKLAEGAQKVNQIAPPLLTKLQSDIKQLQSEGRPIRDLFDVSDAPKDIIQLVVGLGELANKAGVAASPENLPLVAAKIAEIGDSPEAVSILQLLAGGFAEANKNAADFAGTLAGLQDSIKDLPKLSDALGLSPDILNKDAIGSLQKFIADQQEALTGIKAPEGIFFGAEGSAKQVQAANDFGAALDKFVLAKLVDVRNLDQVAFEALRDQWNQTVDAISTSQLDIDARGEVSAKAAKLVALFNEFKREGKLTKEVQLVFENEFEKLRKQIRGEETDPLIIDVNFDIHTQELMDKLNQIAAGVSITIPVTIAGQVQQIGAAEIFGPNGFITNPGITGLPSSAERDVKEKSKGLFGIFDTIDQAVKTLTDVQNTAAESLGANQNAASGAAKELSAFEKELLKIQEVMKELNITAQEFVDINQLTGLSADELDLLSTAFKNLGLDAEELTARLKEINIRNLAKALGVSDQALDSGAFVQFLKNALGDMWNDPKTLAAFQKLISAFATEQGGRQISGLEGLFGNTLPGTGENDLAGLAAAFPNQSPETVLKILRDAGLINFAQGGIVSSPTLAMLGELRRPEAVIPLDRMNQIFGRSGGATGNNGFNSNSSIQNTYNIIGSDAGSIAQRTMNRMGRFEQIRNSRMKSIF